MILTDLGGRRCATILGIFAFHFNVGFRKIGQNCLHTTPSTSPQTHTQPTPNPSYQLSDPARFEKAWIWYWHLMRTIKCLQFENGGKKQIIQNLVQRFLKTKKWAETEGNNLAWLFALFWKHSYYRENMWYSATQVPNRALSLQYSPYFCQRKFRNQWCYAFATVSMSSLSLLFSLTRSCVFCVWFFGGVLFLFLFFFVFSFGVWRKILKYWSVINIRLNEPTRFRLCSCHFLSKVACTETKAKLIVIHVINILFRFWSLNWHKKMVQCEEFTVNLLTFL